MRGFSRYEAMLFGFRLRAKHSGFVSAAAKSITVICQDILRASLYWTLRLVLVIPLRSLFQTMRFIAGKVRPVSSKSRSERPETSEMR